MDSPPQQLDIFADSRDVMLRNDVLDALERRDVACARTAWAVLAADDPQHDQLAALDLLVQTLERHTDTPLPDHDALARARQVLAQEVLGAARRVFGDAAGAVWLHPQWRSLAQRAAGLPFRPDRAQDHAAPLWLRGEEWAAAAQAVESIESWRRIPVPLAWMVEARCRLGLLDDTWPLLSELAWLAPVRFDELLRQLDDPLLRRLHKQFGAGFDATGEPSDLAWFPAWVLTQSPALAPRLALAWASQHTAPERAMRLMVELLGLERQGRHHDVVQRRRALRDLNEPLYAAYMATR